MHLCNVTFKSFLQLQRNHLVGVAGKLVVCMLAKERENIYLHMK